MIDPVHAWRQALVAADVVLGDFGAVSCYAAALGIPVMLAATGQDRLDPEAPLSAFVRDAPRLDPHRALREQVEGVIAAHRPLTGPAEFTSSAPGASAALLRQHFYALMDLPEPEAPALLEPLPLPPYGPPLRTAPLRVRSEVQGAEVVVERSTGHPYGAGGIAHLTVHEDTLDPGILESADVITPGIRDVVRATFSRSRGPRPSSSPGHHGRSVRRRGRAPPPVRGAARARPPAGRLPVWPVGGVRSASTPICRSSRSRTADGAGPGSAEPSRRST
ncbi:hypothetical protein ACWC98_19220 [Streptomyces goshikiensis]